MKKLSIFILVALMGFSSCSGQKEIKNNSALASQPDSSLISTKPNENISVHSEYDDAGNLIAYDSVYTYSYASHGANAVADSLLQAFKQEFDANELFQHDPLFEQFFNPSNNGFNQSFFEDDFLSTNPSFETIKHRMDSIINQHFNR